MWPRLSEWNAVVYLDHVLVIALLVMLGVIEYPRARIAAAIAPRELHVNIF